MQWNYSPHSQCTLNMRLFLIVTMMKSKTEAKQNPRQAKPTKIHQKLHKKHASFTDEWRAVDWKEGMTLAMKSAEFMQECKKKCDIPDFNINGYSLLMRLKHALELNQCYLTHPVTLVPNATMRAILFLDFEPCSPPKEEDLLTSVPIKELELPATAPEIWVHSSSIIFF
jgi:hypothetical protein